MTSVEEAAELGREVLAAVNNRDWDAALRFYAADAVWEHNLGLGSPAEGVYRGHSGLRRLWLTVGEAWQFHFDEPDEVRELEDGRFLTLGTFHITGASSGAPAETRYGMVATLDEGRIVRHQFFNDRSMALAAAGLPE